MHVEFSSFIHIYMTNALSYVAVLFDGNYLRGEGASLKISVKNFKVPEFNESLNLICYFVINILKKYMESSCFSVVSLRMLYVEKYFK